MIKKIALIIVFLYAPFCVSQNLEYTSFLLPDSLKTNANAVIQLAKTDITVAAIDELIVSEKRVVTVLNKLGQKHVDAYASYDKDTRIVKLSASIYNNVGGLIKKIPKHKFIDESAVDSGTLYSDSRVKYIDYTPTAYPYTVVFEVTYKSSSTGFIPGWFPIDGYYVSVKNSTYVLNNPNGIILRKKEKQLDGFPVTNRNAAKKISYQLLNQPAITYERHAESFRNTMPNVLFSLNDFALKGVKGHAANWKEFGEWMQLSLLAGRDILPETVKRTVTHLTAGINNPIDKAKIIYKYMQERTRYIGVQVGIGGFEPITAKNVDADGYGDCKGLTNYTKALMNAVGVEAYYTIVYVNERRDIDANFSSIQGNHIILNLPNNGNDIWLECTSQTKPFGFLGDFTDDRNVLVVTPNGGVIKRTTAYLNDDNGQHITATIQLDNSGNATAQLTRVSTGIQYDDKYDLATLSNKDKIRYYTNRVWSYNNNLTIADISLENNKETIEFTETASLSIEDYANVSDTNYLVRLNVLNKIEGVPKRYRNRKQPLVISRGFTDVDEYTITIPEGYTTVNNALQKNIDTKFGVYSISLEPIDDNTLKYRRVFSEIAGKHTKEDYKAYRSFRKKVTKNDNIRIELIKK